MRRIIAALLLAASTVVAAPPTYRLELDVQKPTETWALDVFRNNTYTLQVDFSQRGSDWDATGYTPLFRWGTNYLDSASMSTVTGTVSGSSATYTLDATQTATNGEWFAEILVQSNATIRTWNQGWYKVRKSPGAGSPSAASFGSIVNYSGVASYVGVTAGPYRAGSNITFTANGDGSQDINATAVNTNTQAYIESIALPLSGGTMAGNINMVGGNISNCGTAGVYRVNATRINMAGTLDMNSEEILGAALGSNLDANTYSITGAGTLGMVQAITNALTFEYWTASNRWASVQRIGSTTNVTFISP